MAFQHIVLAAVLVLFTVFSGCSSTSIEPEFKQGFQMVRSMVAPTHLSRSMFSAAYPECKPSQYVSYYFSTLGSAERPPTAEMAEMEGLTPADLQAAGHVVHPSGIAFVPQQPDPIKGKQIVMKADDSRMMIILEAYETPTAQPVATEEIPLKVVTADAMARQSFESNRQMGIGY